MPQIVANWITTGTGTNTAVVGNQAKFKVEFEFTNPPKSAKGVVITIDEKILDLDKKQKTYSPNCTKEFHGLFENSKFTCTLHRGGADRSTHRNNEYRISLAEPPAVNIMRATIDDPELVSSHTCTLKTTFKGAKKGDDFTGTQQIHVKFPLAMVVPKGTATLDKALNMIPKYAASWKTKDTPHRTVEGTTIVVTKNLKGTLTPSTYDDIIRALTAAANAATAGVVALSVGHGSAGKDDGVPFFNLIPEDNKQAQTGVKFLARIDQTDLAPYDEPSPKDAVAKNVPMGNIQVRLDALDRLGDALRKTPIRRLLLHTCNAGNAPDFIQMIANRLQIPVVAQTDFVIFEPAASYYQSDRQATLPRDEEFWPTHKLGSVMLPRKDPKPPRFGPPKPTK
jgi:hypothetical protein